MNNIKKPMLSVSNKAPMIKPAIKPMIKPAVKPMVRPRIKPIVKPMPKPIVKPVMTTSDRAPKMVAKKPGRRSTSTGYMVR